MQRSRSDSKEKAQFLESSLAYHENNYARGLLDKYIAQQDLMHEGLVRSNIAHTLHMLGRYDDARNEILGAMKCLHNFGNAAEPWGRLYILHKIEAAMGNLQGARTAWQQARDTYLIYRQQGGYAQKESGKLADQVWVKVKQGEKKTAVRQLSKTEGDEELTPNWTERFVPKLLAVLDGERDEALADDESLDFDESAEVLLLMWRLA